MYEPKEPTKEPKSKKSEKVEPIIDQFVEPIIDYSKLLSDLNILVMKLKDNGIMNQELLNVMADLDEVKKGGN